MLYVTQIIQDPKTYNLIGKLPFKLYVTQIIQDPKTREKNIRMFICCTLLKLYRILKRV